MNKRDELIEIATKLFSERGYENTPVSAICAEANVSKGLISHHFKSKDGLLREIFIKAVRITEDINNVVSNATPNEQLIELINSFFAGLKKEKLLFSFIFNVTLQPNTRKILKDLIELNNNSIHNAIFKIFKRKYADNYLIESYMFIARFDGITYRYIETEKEYPLMEMKEYLIREYC